MLRFSKKADYAILLLAHLARDTEDQGAGETPPRSAQELAEATGLSGSLTANILKEYTKADILSSVRGAHGGYRLDRDPDTLSLREILEVVEGPLNLVDCISYESDAAKQADDAQRPAERPESIHETCTHAGICPSRGPLQALQERIYAMLDRLPLSELARQSAASLPHLPSQV